MRWSVNVRTPKKREGKSLYLLARRRVDGRREEQRMTTHTTDLAEAQAQAQAWERDLNAPTAPPAIVATVADVMAARIADLEADPEKSRHSVGGARNAAKKIGPLVGHVLVDQFRREHILELRRELRVGGKGIAPTTIKTYEAWLSSAWRWCQQEGLIDQPWPAVRKLAAKVRSSKRPYTDEELVALLEWASTYQDGFWLPVLQLLADTGRRVSEVLALRGRDLDREACTMVITQKRSSSKAVLTVPVPAATMALLREAGPDDLVFATRGRGGKEGLQPRRAVRRESVRAVVKKGLAALGVVDADRLDTHSLRRAFVSAAERAGIPADVGRRITGHETRAMWEHYQAETVGDDLHQAVEAVRERRLEAAQLTQRVEESPPPAPPPTSPQGEDEVGPEAQSLQACTRNRTGNLIITNGARSAPQSRINTRFRQDARGEGRRDFAPPDADRRVMIWGRLDPDIEAITRWADEDPAAMERLLADPTLQAQLLDSMRSLGLASQHDQDHGASAG